MKGDSTRFSVGADFGREIEELIVESSSGQWKRKDPMCVDF
jgi:hypothetical protein